MKTYIPLLSAVFAISSFATNNNLNGSFEKCCPDGKGGPQAINWNRNKVVSQKSQVQLIKDADCVKSGNFALLAEVEKGGYLFYRSLEHFSIEPNNTISMEIFVNGSGKYSLQYIVYGADDPKKQVFLCTNGTGRPKNAKEAQFEKHAVKVTFIPPAKAKGKFTKFTIIPVIVVESDSKIYFDDFDIKITK